MELRQEQDFLTTKMYTNYAPINILLNTLGNTSSCKQRT